MKRKMILGCVFAAACLLTAPLSADSLDDAAGRGDVAAVRLFVEAGAGNASLLSALNLAARNGQEEVVDVLLDAGADVYAPQSHALSEAARWGHAGVIRVLLKAGPHLRIADASLFDAASNGHEEVTQVLLDAGGDVNAEHRNWGRTPLTDAIRGGHAGVVRVLLKAGADVELKYPLHLAAHVGNVEVAQLLLDAGADANLRDDRGDKPAVHALRGSHMELASVLMEAAKN